MKTKNQTNRNPENIGTTAQQRNSATAQQRNSATVKFYWAVKLLILLMVVSNLKIYGQCPNTPTFYANTISACSTNVSLTVSNYTVGTVNWTFSPAGVGVISTGGPNAIVSNIPSNAYVYVTATITNTGCASVSNTFIIQPCCNSSQPGVPVFIEPVPTSFNSLPSYTQTNLSGQLTYSLTNETIEIHGKMDVDRNLVFNNCTLLMGPGAEINVRPNIKFSLYQSTVQRASPGCGYMWKGIKTGNLSQLYVAYSTIKNAQYGLDIPFSLTLFDVKYTTFSQNYVGVYFEPSQSLRNLGVNPIFASNTFTGGNLSATPFPGQIPPPTGMISYAGMIINDVEFFETYKDPLYPVNAFSNLNIGIASFRSGVGIYHCTFTGIAPVNINFPASAKYNGSALYVEGGSVVVGGVNSVSATKTNQFTACFHSLLGTQCNAYVYGNTFSGPSTEHINLWYCIGKQIDISGDNYFSNYRIGCSVSKCHGSTINIAYNRFYSGQSSTGSFDGSGIYVYNNGLPINIGIHRNEISSSRIGIYATGIKNANSITQNIIRMDQIQLDINNVLASGRKFNGIWLDNCQYISLEGNSIMRAATSSTLNNLQPQEVMRGITQSGCSNNTITFTTTQKLGTPIYFTSANLGTKMTCNGFNADKTGIYLNAAVISPQGITGRPNDNRWFNYNSTTNRVDGTTTTIPINWFYRGNPYSTSNLNDASVSPCNGFVVNAISNNNGPDACSYLLANGNDVTLRELQIIVGQENDSVSTDEFLYFEKLYAYKMLRENDSLLLLDPSLQNFYDSIQETNPAKFDSIEYLMRSGQLLTAIDRLNSIVDQNQIEYNKRVMETIIAEEELDSLRELSEGELAEITDIANQSVFTGGEGVYLARGRLGIEKDDTLDTSNLRRRNIKSSANKTTNSFVSLRPNPSNGIFKISYNASILNLVAEVYSLEGKQLAVKPITDTNLHLSELQSGLYFVKWKYNGTLIKTEKIIISK